MFKVLVSVPESNKEIKQQIFVCKTRKRKLAAAFRASGLRGLAAIQYGEYMKPQWSSIYKVAK